MEKPSDLNVKKSHFLCLRVVMATSVLLAGACSVNDKFGGEPLPGRLANSAIETTTTLSPLELPDLTPPTELVAVCHSLGTVQPGLYFNSDYRKTIDAQLNFIKVAFSSDAKINLNTDSETPLQLVHNMQDDPMFADAITLVFDHLKADPAYTISTDDFLSLPVTRPVLCAPQRLDDVDTQKQIEEIKQVGGELLTRSIQHVPGQTSSTGQLIVNFWQREWADFSTNLDNQLAALAGA